MAGLSQIAESGGAALILMELLVNKSGWVRVVFPTVPQTEVAARTMLLAAEEQGPRAAVGRLILLVGMAACFTITPGPGPIACLFLLPGLAQGVLELAAAPYVRANSASRSRWAIVAWVVRVKTRTANRLPLNVTGVLGTVACVMQVSAIAWVLPAGSGWARVVALVLAVLYLNSGITSVVIDPVFNLQSVKYLGPVRVLRSVIGPLLAAVLLVVLVWAPTPWGNLRPTVALICLLPLSVSIRARDTDRVAAFASDVADGMIRESRADLQDDLHGQLTGEAKAIARLVGRLPDDLAVPEDLRIKAAVLPSLITGTRALVDRERWLNSPKTSRLQEIAEKLTAGFGFDLRFEAELVEISDGDFEMLIYVLQNLVSNAREEYHRHADPDSPQHRAIGIVAGAAVHADRTEVSVKVADGFEAIPDEVWDSTYSSLFRLRQRVQRRSGQMWQEVTSSGKTVHARWPAND